MTGINAALVTGLTAIIVALLSGIFAYIAGMRQAEYQARFTRIYEEQATVVARLFTLVTEAEKSLGRYSYPFGSGQQVDREEAANRFIELHDYYRANTIWLDDRTCATLDSLFNEINRLFSDMGDLTDPNPTRRAWNLPDDPTERQKIRKDIANRALKEIPTIRERLKEQFKELLKVAGPVPIGTRLAARFYERRATRKGPEE